MLKRLSLMLLIVLALRAEAGASPEAGELIFFDSGPGTLQSSSLPPRDGGSCPAYLSSVAVPPQISYLRRTGRNDNRVDVVYIGDGYTAEESIAYEEAVSALDETVFLQEPLAAYQPYFNVLRLFAASRESGIDNDLLYPQDRDTVLGMEFWCHDTADSICVDVATTYDYAAYAPASDQIIVVGNSTRDAGAAYPFSDIALITSGGSSSPALLVHQLGHSLGNLADELDTGSFEYYTGFEPAEPNVTTLTREELTAQRLKWHRWLGADFGELFDGTVGSFEGAMGSQYRVFRPTLNSRMRAIDRPFNLPSAESLIIEIYKLVSPIDDATPANVPLNGSNTFFVTPMRPLDHALTIQWSIDGMAVNGANGETFRPNDYRLTDGVHQVSVVVTDLTPLVRNETARARYLTATRSWSVTIDQDAPIITSHPQSLTLHRGETAVFAVQAEGEALRYQWYRDGIAIAGATSPALSAAVISLGQSGSRYWVEVKNLFGSVLSNQAVLTVYNRAPIVEAIPLQQLLRNELRTLTVTASDPDQDLLSFTAEIVGTGTGARAAVQDGKLVLTAGPSFLGAFRVALTASDGVDSQRVLIDVVVVNAPPVLDPPADIRVHRGVSTAQVTLHATDPDGDPLVYFGSTDPTPILRGLSVTGSTVTFVFNPAYEGTFVVRASVSDGRALDQKAFQVAYYNNAPLLDSPSAGEAIPWHEDRRVVAFQASDPDGDNLTFDVATTGNWLPYFLDQQYDFRPASDGWSYNVFGLGEKHFRGVDKQSGRGLSFMILPDGKLYLEFGPANSQFIAELPCVFHRDPRLLFDVRDSALAVPVRVMLEGRSVVIDPESDYRGSFWVILRASDGYASATQMFFVAVYDAVAVLDHIPAQSMHWREDSRQLTIGFSDPDGSPTGGASTLTVSPFDTRKAYELDQLYNFMLATTPTATFGRSEKLLLSQAGALFAVLPNGELYRATNGALETQPLALLPRDYYDQPALLCDVPPPVVDPIRYTLNGNVLTIDPPLHWTGTTFFTVLAQSGGLSDTQVVALTVYNSRPDFMIPNGERMIYRNGYPSLAFTSSDEDKVDLPFHAFRARLGMARELSWNLAATHAFTVINAQHQYNLRGWREKYVRGSYQGAAAEFFLLPNGSLYAFQNSIEASPLIAELDASYYRYPEQLLEKAPSGWMPPNYGATRIWFENNILYLSRPPTNTANLTFTVEVTDGHDRAPKMFSLGLMNRAPVLEPILPLDIHWLQAQRSITLVATDEDQDPITFAAELVDTTIAYNLDQQHDFYVPPTGIRYNIENYQEKYLEGTKNQSYRRYYYFILPNGDLYEHYRSVPQSIRLGNVGVEYYEDPSLLVDAPPPLLKPVSFAVQGNTLMLTQLEQGWLGSFFIRAYASDGMASASRFCRVRIYDNRPKLGELAAQDISYRSGGFSLTLAASDPDGEPPIFSARVGTHGDLAAELDRQYDFAIAGPTHLFNRHGFREKTLYGTVNGIREEFAVLPNGALYRWKGRIATSTKIAQLSEAYYANPLLLVDTPSSAALPPLTVTVNGSTLTVTFPPSFAGSTGFTVVASDGNLIDLGYFALSRGNHPPQIDPLGDALMHWRTDKLSLGTKTSDFDADPLTLTAALYDTTLAYQLDRANDFFMPLGGIISNREGLQEKLFQGTKNSANYYWYALLPDGGIYDYRTRLSSSIRLGTLATTYWADIPMLFDIAPPSFTPAVVSASGGSVLVDPIPGWTGKFVIQALVSDGPASALSYGTVTVYNTPPELAEIDNVISSKIAERAEVRLGGSDADTADVPYLSYSAFIGTDAHRAYALRQQYQLSLGDPKFALNQLGWREKSFRGVVQGQQQTFSVLPNGELRLQTNGTLGSPLARLSTAYYENPQLLLAAADPGTLVNAPLSVSGNLLTVTRPAGFEGSIPITALVSDGNAYAARQFTVTFGNSRPALAPVGELRMHWRPGVVTTTLSATDADRDSLQYSAALIGNAPIFFTVTGSTLQAQLLRPWVGTTSAVARVSDGAASDAKELTVVVTNTAPLLAEIPSVKWKYRAGTIRVPFSATDANNDPLTFRAESTGAPVRITDAGLEIAVPDRYLGTFTVTLSATDSVDTAMRSFTVEVTNTAPVLSPIADQKIPWRESERRVSLTLRDAEANPLSYSFRVLSGALVVQPRVEGTTLVLGVPTHELGSSRLELTATDGDQSVAKSFTVEVTNSAPNFPPVPPHYAPLGTQNIEIEMIATDADQDPLTFSAQVISPERIAYELDQRHNFELRFGDYYYNLLGNNEKYVQGTKNEPDGLYWYVIYPNGDLYEWREKLSESIYYGKLPTQFYDDPSLLFDVPEPYTDSAPAIAAVEGSILRLTMQEEEFVGQFLVRAKVTDTKAEIVQEFVVELFDPDEGEIEIPDDGGSCETEALLHTGEFPLSTFVSSFTAEGRIGDSVTGPGPRTFEVDVSRSTAGPFANGETSNYLWRNSQAVNFVLEFKAESGQVEWSIDGTKVRHRATVTQPLTDLLLRARAVAETSLIQLSDLKLNGEAIGVNVGAGNSLGGVNVLQIKSARLNAGFTLEGTAEMRFGSSGTTKNSELAFQISAVNVAEHPSSCDEGSEKKITICHVPPGNPENAHTITVGRSALPAHLDHGDYIGECPGEAVPHPETCDSGPALQTPVYTQWNTVLGMRNVLELANRGASTLAVRMGVYSIAGEKVHEQMLSLGGFSQLEVALETIAGIKESSQGLIRLDFEGPLDGRMVYKRADSKKSGQQEFVFSIPLADGLFGVTAVNFNTMQPSTVAAEAKNRVMNWLSITNLDAVPKQFRIETYNSRGRLLLRREIEVYPLTRMNLDGGHDLAGPRASGVHLITPLDLNTEYLAELTRFGGNNRAGTVASEYRFALPFTAQLPQSDPLFVPITRKRGETSWVEVSNTLGSTTRAAINLFSSTGKLIESIAARIPAYGQTVVNAEKFLKVGESGFAQVIPSLPRSLVVDSVVYYRTEPEKGSVTAAYSALGRKSSPCLLAGGYNITNSVENWVLVSNPGDATVTVAVAVQHPTKSSERIVTLKRRQSVMLAVHAAAHLGAPANSEGIVYARVRESNAKVFAQLVRLRKVGAQIDFAAQVPLR